MVRHERQVQLQRHSSDWISSSIMSYLVGLAVQYHIGFIENYLQRLDTMIDYSPRITIRYNQSFPALYFYCHLIRMDFRSQPCFYHAATTRENWTSERIDSMIRAVVT